MQRWGSPAPQLEPGRCNDPASYCGKVSPIRQGPRELPPVPGLPAVLFSERPDTRGLAESLRRVWYGRSSQQDKCYYVQTVLRAAEGFPSGGVDIGPRRLGYQSKRALRFGWFAIVAIGAVAVGFLALYVNDSLTQIFYQTDREDLGVIRG